MRYTIMLPMFSPDDGGGIIPPNQPPRETGGDGGVPQQGKKIKCECCGSMLDRHGNLLRRGELAKEFLNAEDTIEDLRKQLKTATDTLTATKQELASAREAATVVKPRSRFSLGADA